MLKLFKQGYSSATVGHEYANQLLVSAVAEIYLERMKRKYSDIREYIEVLECFRPCEKGGDT